MVDTSGIHSVGVVFCGCVGVPKNNIQKLQVQWFPGTIKDPHSAYAFDALNTFHLLNLQGSYPYMTFTTLSTASVIMSVFTSTRYVFISLLLTSILLRTYLGSV